MNHAVMFSRATDEWATPRDLFRRLDAEFHFTIDAAATPDNRLCADFYGLGNPLRSNGDSLANPWHLSNELAEARVWLNPPYSRCREFIAKAAQEAAKGCTVVCLVPARTDTRWFHEHIYDASRDAFRPGVEVRFIKGRLKFGDATNSAPFPSMVVIFRPVSQS